MRVFDLVNNHPVLVFQDFEVIESPILVFLKENKNYNNKNLSLQLFQNSKNLQFSGKNYGFLCGFFHHYFLKKPYGTQLGTSKSGKTHMHCGDKSQAPKNE